MKIPLVHLKLIPVLLSFLSLVAMFFSVRNLILLHTFSTKDSIIKSLVSSSTNVQDCKDIKLEYKNSHALKDLAWGSPVFFDNSLSNTQCLVNQKANDITFHLKKKSKQVCAGLRDLATMLELNPYSTEYKLLALRFSFILKSYLKHCNIKESNYLFTTKDVSEVPNLISAAQTLSPYDLNVLYFSALVYLNLGNKNEALSHLNLVEELDPFFTDDEKQFFYSLVSTEQELQIAIARHYPSVKHWIEKFYSTRQIEFYQWSDSFTTAYAESMDKLKSDFDAGAVTSKEFNKELDDLVFNDAIRSNDRLRIKTDEIYFEYCKKETIPSCLKLFNIRKTLNRLIVKKSVIQKDKDPDETPLSTWQLDDSEENVRFNIKERTIGINLEPTYDAQLLILENDHIRRDTDNTVIMLWGSEDNVTYKHIENIESSRVLIGNRELIAITFKSELNFPYIKVQYKSSDQTGTFRNKLSSLIQLYGKSK
ncbi:MAG: hypothetical protein KBC84_09360 [Proteobacteria bacterium]|nr:hypothetical protein [Pseudomonadota bacterium]